MDFPIDGSKERNLGQKEFGTKRIGNGAALQMNSRCMSSCSRKHSQSLPGELDGHGSQDRKAGNGN